MFLKATDEQRAHLEKLRIARQNAGEYYNDMRRIAADYEAPMVQEARPCKQWTVSELNLLPAVGLVAVQSGDGELWIRKWTRKRKRSLSG